MSFSLSSRTTSLSCRWKESVAASALLRSCFGEPRTQYCGRWYRQRQKDEDNPALRELLRRDREHLDEIQTLTASTREFLLAFPMPKEGCENPEVWITRTAKSIADYGFRVRTAEEKDMRRLLSVYYRQDAAAEAEEMYEEGERA